MFGGISRWLHSHVAGLQRAQGSRGWRDLLLAPSPDSRIGYASSSLATLDGQVGVGWALPPAASSPSVCGTAPDGSTLTLTCLGADGYPAPGGAFTGVSFASYGQPIGGCFGPLRAGTTCAANTSTQVVAAACVGKQTCSVQVSASTFGGTDPCPGHQKTLAVKLTGNGACVTASLSVSASVPASGYATVVLPLGPAGDPSTAVVWETGAGKFVWAGARSDGGYVPGTDGVSGVTATTTPSGLPALAVAVGSGTYAFELSQL